MFYGVGHDKQVNWNYVLLEHLIHAINPRNDAIRMVLKMVVVLRKGFEEDFELIIVHSLNNELLVMREKEEAARFALGLTGLEHLVAVELGRQRVLDLIAIDVVDFPDFLELFGSVFVNGHFLVNGQEGWLHHAILAIILRNLFLTLLFLLFLNILFGDEVLKLGFVPLLWVLDLDPIKSTNAHHITFLLIHSLFKLLVGHGLLFRLGTCVFRYRNVLELLDAL